MPISTNLGTMHPWAKRIQVCSNEGPCPFPIGDNFISKNTDDTFKSSSLEPLGQIQPNLAQCILGRWEVKFFLMKGDVIFQEEIITK